MTDTRDKILALASDPAAPEGEREAARAALQRLGAGAVKPKRKRGKPAPRGHGEGSVRERSPGKWELRYRYRDEQDISRLATKTVKAADRADALKQLRASLGSVDDGSHVPPGEITVVKWIERWLSGIEVDPRTAERYGQLLRLHVVPTLGTKRLQALRASDLDALYASLKGKISDRTRHHVHVVLGTCLRAAVRKDMLARNPVANATPPRVQRKVDGEDVGIALSKEQLTKLAGAFRGHPLSLFVATAIGIGARRNELLALRWSDFDAAAKTLRIARAVTEPKEGSQRVRKVKAPKTATGLRTVTLDDGLVAALTAERAHHQRLLAGLPADGDVDLSLIKLPAGALIFPAVEKGLSVLRDANAVTRTFERSARKALGFPKLRLHDLRHTHGSRLIAAGLPITVIAARLGHTPEVLLRIYAHELKAAEEQRTVADAIAALAIGV
ncbi:MAG TPA: site-specific integrase [Stellaceae bacterium]|jgi:integrase|nr:site-specific integrase [Stellaceae bacterium]